MLLKLCSSRHLSWSHLEYLLKIQITSPYSSSINQNLATRLKIHILIISTGVFYVPFCLKTTILIQYMHTREDDVIVRKSLFFGSRGNEECQS